MHDTQSPRRLRNQPEIDQLAREFWDSGLNQREFAQDIKIRPLTVTCWIRTTLVDGANPPASKVVRVIDPSSPPRFVEIEIRQKIYGATLDEWPEIVTPTAGKCGFPLGLSLIGSVSFWPSCPRDELIFEHTGLPCSWVHQF